MTTDKLESKKEYSSDSPRWIMQYITPQNAEVTSKAILDFNFYGLLP